MDHLRIEYMIGAQELHLDSKLPLTSSGRSTTVSCDVWRSFSGHPSGLILALAQKRAQALAISCASPSTPAHLVGSAWCKHTAERRARAGTCSRMTTDEACIERFAIHRQLHTLTPPDFATSVQLTKPRAYLCPRSRLRQPRPSSLTFQSHSIGKDASFGASR